MARISLAFSAFLFAAVPLHPASTPVRVGPQFLIYSATSHNQLSPSIATTATGGFVVTWTDYHNFDGCPFCSSYAVRGQRLDNSGTLQGESLEILSSAVHWYTIDSVVAAGAAGEFVVAWGDRSLGGYYWGEPGDVYASRYSALGAPLGTFQVNTFAEDDQFEPAIASDSAGNFVVAWTSSGSFGADTSDTGILGQRFSSMGTPIGGEFQVNSYTTGKQEHPALTILEDGSAVMVWRSSGSPPGGDSSAGGIVGQRYSETGEPLDGEFQVNSFTTGSQNRPSIAAAGDGRYVAVWESGVLPAGGDSSAGILARRFAQGVPQGIDFQVNVFTPGVQELPAVAGDTDGEFIVVWQSDGSSGDDNFDTSIQGRRFSRDGAPLGTEFQVNSYTSFWQREPAIASDGNGDFVVIWRSAGSIQAQRYRVTGDLQGTVFLDRNGNGLRGPAEPGVPGVTVELYDDTATLRRTTVTDAAGNYSFRPKEGDWTVKFVPPSSSWQFTSQDTGGDDAVDSDADPATGETDPFPIAINVLESTIDAGFLLDLFADGFESGDLLAWSASEP